MCVHTYMQRKIENDDSQLEIMEGRNHLGQRIWI